MRHLGVSAFILVAITAAATEVQAGLRNVTSVSAPARVSKREAILLDNIPVESNHGYRRQSKIIFRRTSRPKGHSYHVHKKPKYVPSRNTYGLPTTARRPPKKHNGKPVKSKYNHLKSRPPKKQNSYPPMKQYRRPVPIYGVPKTHTSYVPQEPAGFGEPPADHFAVNNPKSSYGEPPTDSYGSPLSHVGHQSQSYSYKHNSFGSDSYSNNAHESQDSFPPNNHNSFAPSAQDSYSPSGQHSYPYSPETSYASSHSGKSQDSYSNYVPDPSYAASSHSQHSVGSHDSNEDVVKGNGKTPPVRYTDHGSYSSPHDYDKESQISNFSPKPPVYSNHQSNYRPVQGKKKRIKDTTKAVSKPRQGPRGKKHSEEIIVGGQYAEPPGRYVPKFKPSAQMFTGGDSFVPPVRMALESDEAATSYQSSYVNYKNSNMAFSPQNLNDAFSVTNK